MDIYPVNPSDEPSVRALLDESALPHSDLNPQKLAHFLTARSASERVIVGVVGVECYGEVGLLRSLAVAQPHRRKQLGKILVDNAERYAQQQGVKTLYLLTTTAKDYFAKLGYATVDRAAAPPAIKETAQFRELCPDAATCMIKGLP
ncbi:MAG: arsenic resistance N-acetyltransferase ArsN2 [Cyanobacteria bacterium P01_A01_bin.123]